MPDRADYLAKTLIARMRSLEEVLRDGADTPEAEQTQRRGELVEKVLAIEAGVVDGPTHRMVLSALPTLDPRRATTDKEQAEFAAFLRQRLVL